MDTERKWSAISPRAFTSDGGQYGEIDIASTIGFKAKQKIQLKSNSTVNLNLEVKQVISDTRLIVGPKGAINKVQDITAFLVADNATIEAPEQDRPNIDIKEHERAVYAEEPIMAKRVIPVDRLGNYFHTGNPIPVKLSDGSIDIGTVNAELEVQLNHLDNDPDSGDVHDSVRIGDGVEELAINPDGSLNVNITPSNTSAKVIQTYNEVTSIATDTPTLVTSYTAPIGKISFLQKVFVSGNNIAEYVVKLNGSVIDKKRTYFSGPLNEEFNFSDDGGRGFLLSEGDVVSVEVEHSRPSVGDFNARIQSVEV